MAAPKLVFNLEIFKFYFPLSIPAVFPSVCHDLRSLRYERNYKQNRF